MNNSRSLSHSILDSLSRVTASHNFIPEVDGLRFMAIMPVVVLHLTTQFLRVNTNGFTKSALREHSFLFQIIERGSLGVNLFFVISGFILALPFVSHSFGNGKQVELSKYYVRRLTRLEPPYMISLLLIFAGLVIIQGYTPGLIASLVSSIFYSHVFVFGEWSKINPVTWSLETEVQFYILAPLLFGLFAVRNKILRYLILSLVILVVGYYAYTYRRWLGNFHLGRSVIVYVHYFLTGYLIAVWYVTSNFFKSEKRLVFDLITLIGLVGIYYTHYFYHWYGSVLQNMSIILLFIGVFRGYLSNKLFTQRLVVVIGGMCYSIYLLHYAILSVVTPLMIKVIPVSGLSFPVAISIQCIILVPIVLLISSCFFLFFEKPFMYKNWYNDFPRGYLSRLFQ